MTTLPSAAVQLESVMRSVTSSLLAPGAWLADLLPALLLPGALLVAASALALMLHKAIHV